MIRSMTGFGRYEEAGASTRIAVEIKSVNHRYLDLQIKMPRKFNAFEANIRGLIKKYAERGKVDVFIQFEDYSENRVQLKYNRRIAEEYMDHFSDMAEYFEIENDVTVSRLARFPEVFSMEEEPEDEEQLWKLLSEAIEKAAKKFGEARTLEGENLRADLLGKLDYIEELTGKVIERSPAIVAEYREKLLRKVRELLNSTTVDESQIATEVTVFADKICTDEETVRLKSHIEAVRKELNQGGAVGRKLDFIAQEMNREANTILSKANDMEVSGLAIALKTEIEKVREQIQNIE